ncbi:MAG TPA: putative sugar nucleotidyl transferase [Gemmataceae bacterium]|nr:putative sugar nucleotidyl transferase [Gemmataceae bacterium]
MRICLFEDRRAADLAPLTLTRPASDLLCGQSSLGDKQARHFAAHVVGYLVRPLLADVVHARDPLKPVNHPVWLRAAPTVLVNGRWLPPDQPTELVGESFIGLCDGEVAFAALDPRRLSAISPTTIDDCLGDWAQSLPTREVGGRMIRRPWDLTELNAEQITRDFASHRPETWTTNRIALVGPAERLSIDPSAKIDPMVVADTTNGPVVIGAGAVVTAFTRLEGPCVVGAGTHLIRANVRGGTTLGPQCRIGGEVECSIVQGFSNKAHDGFLGHSYLGEWVNLAAGTTTSDLRNDYAEISVPVNGEEVPTGRIKVGSFVGDHTKTGLSVLLNCGTSLGAFACVLPTGQYAPRDVPSFSRVGPSGVKPNTTPEKLFATADTVMRRRGRELTPALEGLYRSLAGLETPADIGAVRRAA